MPNTKGEAHYLTIKKGFERDKFPGRARLDNIQHKAMEQGRMLERSAGDAMLAIAEAKQQLVQRIENYMNLNKLATTAKMPDSVRPAKLVKDILDFVKKVKEFVEEIQDLIKAIQGVIGYLQMMKARLQAFLQSCLNTLATLIREICNFNLPDLPAIPNLFGALHFDGFAFPHGAFKFNLKFDANFAFGACKLRKPNVNIFRNLPTRPPYVSPSGTVGMQPTFNPPLPNALIHTTQTPAALRQETKRPIFRSDYNPQGAFHGALPSPDQIVSAYELPPDVLRDQVLSLLPNSEGIIADMNPAGFTQSTSTAPTPLAGALDVSLDVEHYRQMLQGGIRAYCIEHVTLEDIVDSSWDWKVVWAWLTYMHQCREARKGVWIEAFQAAYETWVLPGYEAIKDQPVPWHCDPEDAAQITQGPSSVHFTQTFQVLSPEEQGRALWKLTYVEAAILGYKRSTRWDAFAVEGYVTGATRDDLDFQGLPDVLKEGLTDFLLDSQGRANYPSMLSVPEHCTPAFQQVVTWAFRDIMAAGHYTATRVTSRVVYTQLAETIEINYHSQFWKDFRANWVDLLDEDPALVRIVVNYPWILNSAVNPLASRALFERTKLDFQSRDPQWIPGTPYLPTPYIPTLLLPPMQLMLPVGSPNGWGGVNPGHDPITGDPLAGQGSGGNVDAQGNPVPLVFNPAAFLARADIQALSPNTQETLLYLNTQYQALLDIQAQNLGAVDEQIASAQTQILEANIQIAQMEALNYIIPDGQSGLPTASGGTGTGGTGTGGTGTGGTGTGGTGTGDATTPPSEDANVFISPENAITDMVAMAVNGVFALVEKPRLVADIARLDTERQAIKLLAQGLLTTRPDLQTLITSVDNNWTLVLDWMNALSPSYADTTVATPLPAGAAATLKAKLTTYYSSMLLLELTCKTISGGGGTTHPLVFAQDTPATVWVVNHGLGYYPDPTVYNSAGVEIWAEVRNTSLNSFEVRHGVAMTGSVSYR